MDLKPKKTSLRHNKVRLFDLEPCRYYIEIKSLLYNTLLYVKNRSRLMRFIKKKQRAQISRDTSPLIGMTAVSFS